VKVHEALSLASSLAFIVSLPCQLFGQCNNSTQPLSTGRLAEGQININTSGLDQIPTAPGVPTATAQITQAVSDLNSALASNGINAQYSINGSNSGPQVFLDVNTDPGVGAPEVTQIPAGGWSEVADISININQTGSDGTPFFSANGVSAANPMGYDTVFYKMGLHELLHTLGLADTFALSPPDIMNGINSTNDQNNTLGDASEGPSSLLTPCVISQVKAAVSAIHKPAAINQSGDPGSPPPDLPLGTDPNGVSSIYNCIIFSWDEWDDSTNTLTGYLEDVCSS
jgi:hypothetical protein